MFKQKSKLNLFKIIDYLFYFTIYSNNTKICYKNQNGTYLKQLTILTQPNKVNFRIYTFKIIISTFQFLFLPTILFLYSLFKSIELLLYNFCF